MICQTSIQNSARFLALHFPRARFAFSHRDGLETHLQNLNVPSPVLLCLRLALPAPAGKLRACAFLPSARPAVRTPAGDRPSITHQAPARLAAVASRAAGRATPADLPPHPCSTLRSPPGLAVPWGSPAFSEARTGQVGSGDRAECARSPPLAARGSQDRGAIRFRRHLLWIVCVDPRALTVFIVSPNRKNSDAYLWEGRVSENTCKSQSSLPL